MVPSLVLEEKGGIDGSCSGIHGNPMSVSVYVCVCMLVRMCVCVVCKQV